MIQSIRHILAIAQTERILLYRTAKFWVLSGIGLFIVIFFIVGTTIASIIDDSPPGEFFLAGTDSFLALYFFSYVQAVLIIFVAGDFRRMEEKARLDQVMLSRPVTTASWVLGKYFGIVSGLIYLNLALIILSIIGRVFKVIFIGSSFNLVPALEYFALITVPSILFMTSMVFLAASLIRIYALAVLIPLGYVAGILFYFHHDFLGLFDYAGFFVPIFASDWIGFGDVTNVIWQRSFFLALATGLLCLSIMLYPRLRQSVLTHRMTQIACALSLLLAAGIAYQIIAKDRAQQQIRAQAVQFHAATKNSSGFTVKHYDIQVSLDKGKSPLRVKAGLAVHNPNQHGLDSLLFALNGALEVLEVSWNDGSAIPFDHRFHTLTLDLSSRELSAGETDTLRLSYTGTIEAEQFMLDRLTEANGIYETSDGPWIKNEISAWVSDDFAVLPSQCGWYPTAGVIAGWPYGEKRPANFATSELTVVTDEMLTAVSQGERTSELVEAGRRITKFSSKTPVPMLSLNIGEYARLSKPFSPTTVELFFKKEHLKDYDLFEEVADTCYQAVEHIFEVFEDVTGLPYPYSQLSLVEVPTQMQVYMTQHGADNICLQPGVIMVKETQMTAMRLSKEIEDKTKRARRRGQDDSPAKIKRDVFIGTVLDFMLPDRYWRRDGSLSSPLRNYLQFQVGISDPLLDRALELHLFEECERRTRDVFFPDRWNDSMSGNDRMRQNDSQWAVRRRYDLDIDTLLTALQSKPLSELRPEDNPNLYRAAIDFKAPPIIRSLSERIGEDLFGKTLRALVARYRYQNVTRANFSHVLDSIAAFDAERYVELWFDQATFPGYQITRAEAKKIDTGNLKTVYQVSARILNGENGEGFVQVECDTKGDKVRRRLELGSYEEKEIQFPVTTVPKMINVIPFFSRNRGKISKQISMSNRVQKGQPADTAFTVASSQDSLAFVLDDQDEGFFTPINEAARYLRPPLKGKSWRDDVNSAAFGKYYFGWHRKRGSSGEYPARWEAKIPRSGDYDLSFFLPVDKNWITRNLSRNFKLNVETAEGIHELQLQPQETADGWIPLGRFRFEREKPAIIELSDEGDGWIVADAVRWEYVQ